MSPATIDYTHANSILLPWDYKYSHLFKRVYLGTYYEPFRERLVEAKTKAAERGAHYWSEYGFRPMAQQAKLRSLYLLGKGGRAAPAGKSGHQYGLADDSTFDQDPATAGLQPSWNPKHYTILGEELERAGLHWGKAYGDLPHAGWPGFVSGGELQPLLTLWNGFAEKTTDDARLLACWSYLDALKEVRNGNP